MQVHTLIGENHRFTLREALLIYGDERRSFVTRHQVRAEEEGPSSLGPAEPLTSGFLESLIRKLQGSVAAEVLPEAVLAKTTGTRSHRERTAVNALAIQLVSRV